MLLVQEYLKTHTFGDLAREHGVYASFSKSGHKFSLNYDQIEAKEADPLAQECRGLILSSEDGQPFQSLTGPDGKSNRDGVCPGNTVILAYPMKRFFNHGQGSAANINWSDPQLAVLEKLDGTLCIVYHDQFTHEWCVATRSVSEADLLMDNGKYTFRTLFEKALHDCSGLTFEQFTPRLNFHLTYCFELTTPYNRIVVQYDNSSITLLAARYKVGDLREISVVGLDQVFRESEDDKSLPGIPTVRAHTLSSIDAIHDYVSSQNPLAHEGVVVLDSNFNRIKVKNAAYVAYNKLHDRLGSSERNLMEFILLEKDDDIVSVLAPEIAGDMQTLKSGLQRAIAKYDSVYDLIMLNLKALGETKNKKEFALFVTRHHDMWHAPFFQRYDGKVSSMKDFIAKNRKDGTWSDSFLDRLLELAKNS